MGDIIGPLQMSTCDRPCHYTGARWGPATVYPFRIESVGKKQSGAVIIRGAGIPLQSYTVQATLDPGAGFDTIDTITADTQGNLVFKDTPTAGLTERYYRFTRR